MKSFKKRNIKTYKFDKFGYAQAIYDIRKEKQEKIGNIFSIVVLLGFLGLGIMSKEFLLIYFTGKGINLITDFLIK
ncbi:hypothetical protein [Clostridium sp.]|uniref:hypothetical protein n=1 Tax=Clostridium sp. TaxID=1506 RepID=UPI0029148010|nr:hypothetical protein [Clostridium sp.]MDU3410064.1 hypothetical protein [Clostridium sp.]